MQRKHTCTRGTHQGRQRPRFNITINVVKKSSRPTGHGNMITNVLPRKRPPVGLRWHPKTRGSVRCNCSSDCGDALVLVMRRLLRLVIIKFFTASKLLLTLNLVECLCFLVFFGVDINRTAKHFRLQITVVLAAVERIHLKSLTEKYSITTTCVNKKKNRKATRTTRFRRQMSAVVIPNPASR